MERNFTMNCHCRYKFQISLPHSTIQCLQAHINMHNGSNPYNCTFCNKDFAHMADLKKHERVHTGEKPHKCNECDKTFADPSALRKHERRHSKVEAQQHIQCLGCSKSFQKEEAFFKHATLLSTGSQGSRRCPGKPSSLPGALPQDSVVR